ncbi:MAG: AAA family ATPase [Muribaculaceae bacterium]|nr:AAA family ATPase [Muribaculaceae bacterium]
MAIGQQIIIKEVVGNGIVTCQIPLTKEDWKPILANPKLTTPSIRRALMSFYFMPEYKATCTQCANKYGYTKNNYNNPVWMFGKAIMNHLGTFVVENSKGERSYWPVAMGKGRNIKGDSDAFEWTLRQELIEALRDNLMQDILAYYISKLPENWPDERYKWEGVQWFQEHWDIDAEDFGSMFETATAKSANLLASAHFTPRQYILYLTKYDAEAVRSMFISLYDESQPLELRVDNFMNRAEDLRKKYDTNAKNHYQNTNAISTYLWLRYPEKYLIFKSTEYSTVAEKTGLEYRIKQNGKVSEMIKGFKMYGELNQILRNSPEAIDTIAKLRGDDPTLYSDPNLQTLTIDFGFWISRWYTSIEKSLYLNQSIPMDPFIEQACNLLKSKKNLILQGAPGTGKTYNTAALALAIIDGNVPESHDDIMARYEELRSERRIGFTTFHQSMDYEDFIEGIKPVHEAGAVRYEIEDGIFKQLCASAKVASEVVASGTDNLLEGMNSNPTIWKVSLESTGDNPTRRDCMANGYIRVGWSDYGDLDFAEDNPQVTEGKNILRAFQHDMQIGDIVVSCWSQDETDAIGIVTGDYEYRPEGGNLPRYRPVRWIVKGIQHNIKDINNGKHMTLGTVYRLSIQLKDLLDVIELYAPATKSELVNAEKPYVLIIDEINRANVSKVFGELITLIEKDKRIGAEHPVTLSLPYSKQADFGVPQNIYIIGTMNTTDRSTGTLDYAIRRRFAFLTTPARRDIIKDETARLLFDDVKKFIESHKYADMDIEDLMVGHSYFMAENYDELAMKIKFEVIPLIKEYIKDGILTVKSTKEANQYFDAWLQLKAVDDSDSGTSAD